MNWKKQIEQRIEISDKLGNQLMDMSGLSEKDQKIIDELEKFLILEQAFLKALLGDMENKF